MTKSKAERSEIAKKAAITRKMEGWREGGANSERTTRCEKGSFDSVKQVVNLTSPLCSHCARDGSTSPE